MSPAPMRGMFVVTVCADVVSVGISRLARRGQGLAATLARGPRIALQGLGVLVQGLGVLVRALVAAVRGLAFWTAVLLPLAYLPLFAVGTVGGRDLVVVWQLIGINVVALLVGHLHGDGDGIGQELDEVR